MPYSEVMTYFTRGMKLYLKSLPPTSRISINTMVVLYLPLTDPLSLTNPAVTATIILTIALARRDNAQSSPLWPVTSRSTIGGGGDTTIPSRGRSPKSPTWSASLPRIDLISRGVFVSYVPGRGYFRAVPSQNGDCKFATSPTPPQSFNDSDVSHREGGDQDVVRQHVKLLDMVSRRVVRPRQAVQAGDTCVETSAPPLELKTKTRLSATCATAVPQ